MYIIYSRGDLLKKIIAKQLNKLDKKEKKILNKKGNKIYEEKVSPVVEKLESKIPDRLKLTLDGAFYQGFNLVLSKGTKYIEKLYDKDKLQLEYDIKNYAVKRDTSRKNIRNLDSRSKKSNLINKGISTIEGGGLGLLGVGLPDIPLFITMILKTIYEIALSYGFDYENQEEVVYVLNLICGSLSTGEEQVKYNERLDRLAEKIQLQLPVEYDLDEEIRGASRVLSQAMLTSKFVQGLPIVGVVGSVTNYLTINKISKYSSLKYKKRYLMKY